MATNDVTGNVWMTTDKSPLPPPETIELELFTVILVSGGTMSSLILISMSCVRDANKRESRILQTGVVDILENLGTHRIK